MLQNIGVITKNKMNIKEMKTTSMLRNSSKYSNK